MYLIFYLIYSNVDNFYLNFLTKYFILEFKISKTKGRIKSNNLQQDIQIQDLKKKYKISKFGFWGRKSELLEEKCVSFFFFFWEISDFNFF